MGEKHEDLDAYKLTATASNTTNYTVMSGTSAARIHHVNIYNTDTSNTVSVFLKVAEGTLGQDVTLRKVSLSPETHNIWAGALGDDDTFKISVQNDNGSDVVVDLSWW